MDDLLEHWRRVIRATVLFAGVLIAAPRQMERLDRGIVAVNQGQGKVFVSWRLLATDPEGVAFNLYRSTQDGPPTRLNEQPITGPTWFIDEGADLSRRNAYLVRPVIMGAEQPASKAFVLEPNTPAVPYISIPMQTPQGYVPGDASVGDLDGDGEYELVIHMTGRGRDNAQRGFTDPPILHAYSMDGTLLWQINLGRNIREGAHYTQFMVYDLDGDGRAEVACKTADGTVDGKGNIIGDPNADHRDPSGHILKGPEYLTIFDGLTGQVLANTAFIPPRHPSTQAPTPDELRQIWGDGNGNRSERYLAAVAYLDGQRPSLVMCRGYYTRSVLAAWDWRDGRLTLRWVFDTEASEQNRPYRGQGNHNLSIADVDGDGRDEIIYGAAVIDDDGKGLYSTGWGHGDALHVGDLDPDNPGLEVFNIQERFSTEGINFRDARTGKALWLVPSVAQEGFGPGRSEGPGRGVCFNVDPRFPGNEAWALGPGMFGMHDAKGRRISQIRPRSCNFAVWWDGDLLRELLDRNYISKWNWEDGNETILLVADGCVANNGTKATPCLSGDILGDWREEVIWRTRDNRSVRIYTTTIPTKHRLFTLMHDPQYRLAIAWQNVAYNQPPHPSFYLDESAPLPRRPQIVTWQIIDLPPLPPVDPNLPTVFLVGDSTVKCGRDDGANGQWGWGRPLADLFDLTRINVRNMALGGRSSRTFITEGLWDKVLAELKSGDFVLIQFGHNDGGPVNDSFRARGSLKGVGDQTQEIDNMLTGQHEVVHTYGWYIRKYIKDTKAKGATPIVLSPIPRNIWADGKVVRASSDYGKWAAEAAAMEGALFVDLNEIIATRYEQEGQQKVSATYFTPIDHTHTSWAGAKVNAECVAAGLRQLDSCDLEGYLKEAVS
ncbi:MAG: GDSL-type esterase/lipase family protein [Sedimentisphaerales bacterium]|nr:GDSL-type esterase/lipase family protein [Sedimentisphaerales bacterium]